MTFLERLRARVPRPRVHLVTYHGVLAPASPDRALVVPEPPPVPEAQCPEEPEPPAGPEPPCRSEEARVKPQAPKAPRLGRRGPEPL